MEGECRSSRFCLIVFTEGFAGALDIDKFGR